MAEIITPPAPVEAQTSDLAAVAAHLSNATLRQYMLAYRTVADIKDDQQKRDALKALYDTKFKDGTGSAWVADPAFVRQRLNEFANLTETLSTDPAMIDARKNWATYTNDQRYDTLMRVALLTEQAIGMDAGHLVISDMDASPGDEYGEQSSRTITLYVEYDPETRVPSLTGKLWGNFENAAALTVHEALHREQEVLADADNSELNPGQRLQKEYLTLAKENYVRAKTKEMETHPERMQRDLRLYEFNPMEAEAFMAIKPGLKQNGSIYNDRGWKEVIGSPEIGQAVAVQIRARADGVVKDLNRAQQEGQPYDFVGCHFDQKKLAHDPALAKSFTCSLVP